MTTVIYSDEAAAKCGYLTVKTWFGPVNYTCIIDEERYGPWKASYFWEDAKVVAYACDDNLSGIMPPEQSLAEFEEV